MIILHSQQPQLFSDSIRYNIAYGADWNVTDDEIMEAAKMANAHAFIMESEQGYDTLVCTHFAPTLMKNFETLKN